MHARTAAPTSSRPNPTSLSRLEAFPIGLLFSRVIFFFLGTWRNEETTLHTEEETGGAGPRMSRIRGRLPRLAELLLFH
jgi:hypothetical protein